MTPVAKSEPFKAEVINLLKELWLRRAVIIWQHGADSLGSL
jgi:hypothetical protein